MSDKIFFFTTPPLMLSFVTNRGFTGLIQELSAIIKEQGRKELQQLENLINFSAMKPKARYTFSGVESVSFTSYSISFRFSDGDSLDVDFPSSSGRKFIHEEIRDFLKWYGKDDRKQLEETSKVLIKLLEKKEEAEA